MDRCSARALGTGCAGLPCPRAGRCARIWAFGDKPTYSSGSTHSFTGLQRVGGHFALMLATAI